MSTPLHPLIRPTIRLSITELRRQLGNALENTHYYFAQYEIVRRGKPKARLVNELYLQTLERLVQADPALAKTFEIMLDKDFLDLLNNDDEFVQSRQS